MVIVEVKLTVVPVHMVVLAVATVMVGVAFEPTTMVIPFELAVDALKHVAFDVN